MQTIPIDDIDIPGNHERQRNYLTEEELSTLQRSIREEGLINAITLDKDMRLIAGFNRLRCIERLRMAYKEPIYHNGEPIPEGEIPYTITHKTDEVSLFKIELEENLARAQLTPQEEAAAIARLHELMKKHAPEIVPGLKQNVTVKETAQALVELKGEEAASLEREERRVADSILVDAYKDEKEVKNAKSFAEAVRAARKLAARQWQHIYGQMTAEEQPEGRHQVIVGDCQEKLPEIPDGTIDVIILDPPYGVGADKFGEQSLGHEYADDERAFHKVVNAVFKQSSRICRPEAAMFIFLDISNFSALCKRPGVLRDPGSAWYQDWYIWPTPLIWHKPNRGHAPQPKRGPARRYEAILYAIRGPLEVLKVGQDLLSYPVPDGRLHAAGKPPDLYAELLSWVARPGSTVLDPCAGSGTIIEAAELLDCSAIAIEQNEGFAALCRERAAGKSEDQMNLNELFNEGET